jgi:hypothetical protein
MGVDAMIALAALGLSLLGVGSAGATALFKIARGLGSFESKILEVIKNQQSQINRLEQVADRHDERLRDGGL